MIAISESSSLETDGINGVEQEYIYDTNEDMVNATSRDEDCPLISDNDEFIITLCMFWLEGVTQTTLAIMGMTCNTIFSFILSRKELRNSFNILLIILATFDSVYLFGAILESFRKSFQMATTIHIRLFPRLLYPLQGIAMTGSIFMTVAIAFERYVAVHNPINYNRAMNDGKATRSRVVKFFIPVMLASILFSLPKFFESTVAEYYDHDKNLTVIFVNYTSIRVDPTYSFYVNWSRLLVQGVFPVFLLIFFNKRIYCDIKERQFRRRPISQVIFSMVDQEESISHSRPSPVPGQQQSMQRVLSLPIIESNHLEVSRASSPEVASIADRNSKRRGIEDRLAILFMGIVAVFFICSLPRLVLSIHETFDINRALKCTHLHQDVFPLWVWVLTSVSHLFLVINSSVNLLIYCLWNAQFRKVAKAIILNLCFKNKRSQEYRESTKSLLRVPKSCSNKSLSGKLHLSKETPQMHFFH